MRVNEVLAAHLGGHMDKGMRPGLPYRGRVLSENDGHLQAAVAFKVGKVAIAALLEEIDTKLGGSPNQAMLNIYDQIVTDALYHAAGEAIARIRELEEMGHAKLKKPA